MSAEAHIDTIRGNIDVKWFKRYGRFNIQISVPYGTECEYEYGNDKRTLTGGFHFFEYEL